jgi:hypothetical protein
MSYRMMLASGNPFLPLAWLCSSHRGCEGALLCSPHAARIQQLPPTVPSNKCPPLRRENRFGTRVVRMNDTNSVSRQSSSHLPPSRPSQRTNPPLPKPPAQVSTWNPLPLATCSSQGKQRAHTTHLSIPSRSHITLPGPNKPSSTTVSPVPHSLHSTSSYPSLHHPS